MNKSESNQEYSEHLRHSCAHLLAAAVIELWPGTLRTIGPAIENGFYYDFDFGDVKISEEDFKKIEEKMHELVKSWNGFEKNEVTEKGAKDAYIGNQYKIELIEEFSKEKQKLTFYKSGAYSDLCRGGHIENPSKELKHFKLLSVAGAYWRGNEKNKMLTRIYGTIFSTKGDLYKYLKNLELAKLHDHRKLGKELELFAISDEIGQGLVLWLPKGNFIKEEIENWAKTTETEWGYQRVTTPNITKSGLYFTSGHLPYYKADMYPPMTLDDGEEYYLKPMNCPHHHMIYKNRPRSYKELPLRLAEYGTCYRYEASGELFGLMRVRGFVQNDSHIYCTQGQAVEEFVQVMKLHEFYYKSLGIKDYYLELALRDPENKKKYHGNKEMWVLAEKLMREAVKRVDIPMVEKAGSAAFYGPKIDFIIKSSTGREFGISTNQIDLFMGDRFGLKYVDKDGFEKTPVIIHRAPLGSHERFIGFLIEHFGGNFPTWLTPVQVKVLPITDKHLHYAKSVSEKLKEAGIRVELDDRNERLQAKIRDAQKEKVSYMLILGAKEVETKTVTVRARSGEAYGPYSIETFISNICQEIAQKTIN
ncbi:MAG: threonyl-tRNA synthetase [Microgenomates group bacterium Gr01-1014_16]|nr:MAG: threonyl-tRNA synthetase [Microgenomates group bacterium Gr01-1014_16]